jgi:hypothetical protein
MDDVEREIRTRLMRSKLAQEQEKRSALREQRERHEWVTRLAPVIGAINERSERPAYIVEDCQPVIDWLGSSFPFTGPGSTCEWGRVEGSKSIGVSFNDLRGLRLAFADLLAHVGASRKERVAVMWHKVGIPCLSMTVESCLGGLNLLIDVPGQQMHVVSEQGGWYIEFDPFFNECHGGRAEG